MTMLTTNSPARMCKTVPAILEADAKRVQKEAVCFFRQSEVPENWGWVEMLSPLHLRLFAVELSDAIKHALISEDWSALIPLLKDWEATAELDAAPEVVEEIHRSKTRRAAWEATGGTPAD